MKSCDNCGKKVSDKDEVLCRICKPALQIEFEIKTATDKIDKAYWEFCRCARAKPPSLVFPEAYEVLVKYNIKKYTL